MKLIAKISKADGPLKVSPKTTCLNNAQDDHVVAISIQDAKHFLKDFAALFQSKLVGIQDKLIGAIIHEDRVLYCGKRKQWIEKLECLRTIPFAIELIRTPQAVCLNYIRVSEVKVMKGKTIYSLPYGDTELNYIFPIAD
jgi:hypothetical protein